MKSEGSCTCPNCGGTASMEGVDIGIGIYWNTAQGYDCWKCGWNSEQDPPESITIEDLTTLPLEAYADANRT